MDRDEAGRIAEAARGSHEVPPDAEGDPAVRKYIEVCEGGGDEPGPVRDVLVWSVRFRFRSSWVDLDVEDASGEIVRVVWSR